MAGTFAPRCGLGAIVALFVLLVSCSDSPTGAGEDPPPAPPAAVKPTVSTAAVTGVTITTATAGGEVTADGGAPITARGVVWSVSPDPTVDGDRTTDGTGTGSFVSEIAGLSPEGTYYVRAYATNSAGTAYGDEVSFTTDEGTYAIIVLGQVDTLGTSPQALDEDCRMGGNFDWGGGGSRWAGFLWEPGTGFRRIEPGDGNFSFAAMNAGGTVAGVFEPHDSERRRAFTWSESDGVRFYDPPAGSDFITTTGFDLNDHGIVVGYSYVGGSDWGTTAATLWGPDGEAVLLASHDDAEARAINDVGVVAGLMGQRGHRQAVVWLASGQEPVVLPGGPAQFVDVGGINNHGDVAGSIHHQAVLWRDDQAIILEAPSGYTEARAWALTEPDAQGVVRVVGTIAEERLGSWRPVIWTVDGTEVRMEELYPPAGYEWASARAVMVRDGEIVVVGHASSWPPTPRHAVLWTTSREVCGL